MESSHSKSNVLGYLKTGLFFTVIGILVLYIIIGAFFPKQTVKVFGFKPYVVITESMEPEIMVNDLIIVKNPKVDELKVDDIITFEADINFDGTKEIVTHYIYSIEEINGEFSIRTHPYFENSNDYVPDYWVLSEDDILGEYMFKIPKVGAVVEFVKSPFGMAAMVVNIGVIIGVVYLIKKTDI